MQVELISTGEEVLSGQIVDTNAVWLSQFFAERGVRVGYRTTVGDRMEDLIDCFKQRSKRADVLIVTGGLGPTGDDLTAAAAARALDEPLAAFPEWESALSQKFKSMDRDMPPANLKQAVLPRSAEILDNPVGTACGFVIQLNRARCYFAPGVPSEMKPMIENLVWPDIRERFRIERVSLLKRLHCFGVAEARLADRLDNLPLPEGVVLGYRARLPTIEIKIMGAGVDQTAVRLQMEKTARTVRGKLGDHLISEDDQGFAARIQQLMIERGHTLALAESCTGGMIASQLVDIAGSSAYFERGYVTYANAAKTEMLGVPADLIAQQGAVSLEVARAMAEGARRSAGVSHALAVSGVAGPDGGSPEKPVGMVAFALAATHETYAQVALAPNWGRTRIRLIAAAVALDMLRRHLSGVPVIGNYDGVKTVRAETSPIRTV